ncbi:MAG: proteasome-type protease [Rubripirellula sp.]|nr:proteasome-type protease [Rubripirellula sp.]
MTFCVGIKVRQGVVALADTQIVRGSEQVSKQKLSILNHANDSLFVMTSGLRSVRDKSLIYLSEQLEQHQPIDRLYKIVNLFGDQLRKVREEDGASLAAGGLSWNPHAIIGGRLHGDLSPQMFYVYPEGNWVESSADSPYFIIGRTHYGKPILDRLLTFETPLQSAVALALLAFDATRMSVTDVECPIDIAVIAEGSRHATFQRFSGDEIRCVTQWWTQTLSQSLISMPLDWAANLFQGVPQ